MVRRQYSFKNGIFNGKIVSNVASVGLSVVFWFLIPSVGTDDTQVLMDPISSVDCPDTVVLYDLNVLNGITFRVVSAGISYLIHNRRSPGRNFGIIGGPFWSP